MQSQTVLGVDLGPNSVGWALMEHELDGDKLGRPLRLADAGVRIFQQGVEAKRNESRNAARRAARGARRQHQRRNRRRDMLRESLQGLGLLPNDTGELARVMQAGPYLLRARGLDHPLSLHEFGRALYHLGQRRGFKSNRRADSKTADKDGAVVRQGISDLQRKIDERGARTLGEYLASLDSSSERIRDRYTAREMYEHEFAQLWLAQAPHHPAVLTGDVREKLRAIIFNQRPLKVQKNLVGKCELEPDKKRCARGNWYAQRFRLLQDLNHLELPDAATGAMRKLNQEERMKLLPELERAKEMTFDKVRRCLGPAYDRPFNFEQADHRNKIKGNSTEWNLRQVFKRDYDNLDAQRRDEIVRDLLFLDDEAVIRRHAAERWGLDESQAARLAKSQLEPGYLHLSEKAIRALLPHLEKGLAYMDAVEAAGYQRPDQREVTVHGELPLDGLPDLRNPIVMAALHQARRVVNTIVRTYGKPALIRVEMARDLKVSLKKRSEIIKEQGRNRRENEATFERLRTEFGLSNPGRDDLIRYRLWIECGQACPYTGRVITKDSLFSQDWDIEHILPRPRSGDDSYMNKTLCWAGENRQVKHNRIPWEAYGGDQQRWDEILHRVRLLPWPKRRRFLMKDIPEDFISRQLIDTGYIAREARGYFEMLVGKNRVQVGRGGVTAELRRKWGLNKVLSDSGEKTRDDHRHHAVDAVVIALTTPAAVKRISELAARGYRNEDDGVAPPWEGFRDEVKRKIGNIVVAHRVLREIRGALHEETNYGILGVNDEGGKPLFAVRKRLDALSAKEVGQIADDRVREIVAMHLKQHVADPNRAGAEKSREWKAAMAPGNWPSMPNRNGPPVPIKKVRLHKPSSAMIPMKNGQDQVYRAVESGSNHHIVIFEYTDGRKKGRWGGEVVSMFEAARRARAGEPIVRRELDPNKNFVMSLSINEMVRLSDGGGERYCRVQKIDGGNKQITFRLHTAANLEDDRATALPVMPNPLKKLNPVKVTVDPIGRVFRAND